VLDVAGGYLAPAGLEIISGYDIETLKQINGVKLLTNAEKQQYQQLQLQVIQQLAMARAPGPPAPSGQPPGPPGAAAPAPSQAGPSGPPAQGGQMAPGAPPQPATPGPGQAQLSLGNYGKSDGADGHGLLAAFPRARASARKPSWCAACFQDLRLCFHHQLMSIT